MAVVTEMGRWREKKEETLMSAIGLASTVCIVLYHVHGYIPLGRKCCVDGTLGRFGNCFENGWFRVFGGRAGSFVFLLLIRPVDPDACCEGAALLEPSGGIDVLEEDCRRW
jgi:hypothetical protein